MKLIFCLTSIEVEVNSGISSSCGQGCLGLLKVFKVKPHTLAVQSWCFVCGWTLTEATHLFRHFKWAWLKILRYTQSTLK